MFSLFKVLSLVREEKLSLKAYKRNVQANCLQIAQNQKVIEDKDILLIKNKAKLLKLKKDLLEKSKKLKKANNYYFKQGQRVIYFEQATKEFPKATKEAEDTASSLREQMSTMMKHMNSLSTLVEILKDECTKAYKSEVSFMINILKTQAEKLDLFILYFTLMWAFPSSKSKAPPTNTLLWWTKGQVEEAIIGLSYSYKLLLV